MHDGHVSDCEEMGGYLELSCAAGSLTTSVLEMRTCACPACDGPLVARFLLGDFALVSGGTGPLVSFTLLIAHVRILTYLEHD